MTLKFCLGNEIHRSSDVPQDLASLKPFLQQMFHERLPKDYSLAYLTAEGKQIPIETDNDYENLKFLSVAKVFKVLILENGAQPEIKKENDAEALDYDVIPGADKENGPPKLERVRSVPLVEEEKGDDGIQKFITELTRKYVIPDLVKLEADEIPHESMINKVVQEILEKQVPVMVAQVQEKLIQQGLVKLPEKVVPEEEQDAISKGIYQIEEKAGQVFQKVLKAFEGFPESAEKLAGNIGAKISSAVESFEGKKEADALDKEEDKKENEKGFFDSAKDILSLVPGKVNDMKNNLVSQWNGDPLILTVEGKYPKSTHDKADQLKMIFPESDKKEMLDFVESLPKNLTMEQVAAMYADFKNV